MVIEYRNAGIDDALILIDIYNSAFYDDYIRYGECPAYGRSHDRMIDSILRYPKIIAVVDGVPVGVLSYADMGEGCYHIGCLCIIPAYQGRGIGTALLKEFLLRNTEWRTVCLITPGDKERNIAYYNHCGFRLQGKEMDKAVEVVRLVMER